MKIYSIESLFIYNKDNYKTINGVINMLKAINIMKTYYIKKLYFPGENNSVVELISVTEETTDNVNGVQVVTPEILASSIREFDSEYNKFEDNPEIKLVISEELANQLSELVEDQEKFLNLANSLF